jgi:type IV secretion system protein TrbL
MRQKASSALGLSQAAQSGRDAAWAGMKGGQQGSGSGSAGENAGAPGWAQSLQRRQDSRHHRQVAMHAIREGDRGGASATPDIKEKDD